MASDFDLNVAAGMKEALRALTHSDGSTFSAGLVHCPRCGEPRRVMVEPRSLTRDSFGNPQVPFGLQLTCWQCGTVGQVLVAKGTAGEVALIVWPVAGGIATPNTPRSVGYYLDEASKCESSNAHSAAAAMYRAALDHILFEQGYKTGMLGQRIGQLITDVTTGTAPEWALKLDKAYLEVISKVGNGAIHTNDGDVAKQAAIDDELLEHLRATIAELLQDIYELPAQKAARLASMQAKAAQLTKPPKP